MTNHKAIFVASLCIVAAAASAQTASGAFNGQLGAIMPFDLKNYLRVAAVSAETASTSAIPMAGVAADLQGVDGWSSRGRGVGPEPVTMSLGIASVALFLRRRLARK